MTSIVDWVCNPLRPKWQFYSIIYLLCTVIGFTIGFIGAAISNLYWGI